MNLYHCDLVDENTFLAWREELNPTYPAKGDALFEVNRWLMWLENAEEEDEEERKIEAVASSLEATLDINVPTSSPILSDSLEFHVGRLTEKSQTRPTHSLSTVLTTSTDHYQSAQSE
ncbi:unnamed protein product [Dicrocoelium dendriticum]|nr:unnamed protein product [Dicrocoelium dendriticum]